MQNTFSDTPYLNNLDTKFEAFAQDTFNKEVLETKADYAIVLTSPSAITSELLQTFKYIADTNHTKTYLAKEKLKTIRSAYVVISTTIYNTVVAKNYPINEPTVLIFKKGKLLAQFTIQSVYHFNTLVFENKGNILKKHINYIIKQDLRLTN